GNDGADSLTGGAGQDVFLLDANAITEASTSIFDIITDFTVGIGGDILDLSAIHTANLAAGYGDGFAGTEFAYAHSYIKFVQQGADTLVQYDRDGLGGGYAAKTVALLKNTTAASILPGVNTSPALSNNLYLIEASKLSSGLSEDSGAQIQYRVVLGKAPTGPVTLSVQGGDQISVNGSSGASQLVFTASNWWIPQTVTVQAQDDLLIEGNVPASIVHAFSSTDASFDGLSSTLSVSVIDNDFQRTLEPLKVPSAGNNAIRYDLAGDWRAITSNAGVTTGLYDLKAGNDLLDVSASVQSDAGRTFFIGGDGNDTLRGVALATGDAGNDLIEVTTNYVNTGIRVSGGTGNDVLISTGSNRVDFAGGSGNDTLTGGSGNDALYGDGFDSFIITGGDGKDTIYGDDGNQTLSGNDTIDAGADNDSVYGGKGNDNITLGAGNDVASGGDDADQIWGGVGNDTIYGDAGNDTIIGGEGLDSIYGGDGNDTLSGNEANDTLYGEAGNDSLSGDEGNDTLSGGSGDDTLYGGIGDDVLYGDYGNNSL
ncbi:MAG: type I secretion C-terminal target domain-containing protein, partial [Alphaproteobacteria bacterium]|nr:type I secretion C-terminal target domain-containing protein [Alphaproteobacteria bacterium]